MNLIDGLLILIIFLGILHGVLQGLRPALWLLVIFQISLLAGILLMHPLEQLMLNWSGIATQEHSEDPGVAVLILWGETGLAYVAALIPSFITALCLILHFIGKILFKRFTGESSKKLFSRIVAGLVGLFSGFFLSTLFIIQIIRIPWSVTSVAAGNSFLIAVFTHYFGRFLPWLVGGL